MLRVRISGYQKAVIAFFFITLIVLTRRLQSVERVRFPARSVTPYRCNAKPEKLDVNKTTHRNALHSEERPRVLVVSETTKEAKDVVELLTFLKVDHVVEHPDQVEGLLLELNGRPRFSTIIFTDAQMFERFSDGTRHNFEDVVGRHKMTVISFASTSSSLSLNVVPTATVERLLFVDPSFSTIAKTDRVMEFFEENTGWMHFVLKDGWTPVLEGENSNGETVPFIARSTSPYHHVTFGRNLNSWVTQIAFLDTLLFFYGPKFVPGLERFIQIDIDDIFVGQSGTRIVAEDVDVLIGTQANWRKNFVKDFTFTLGFSGSFFGKGTAVERNGDILLLENARKFYWFPHMWRHNHAHEYNYESLLALANLNKQFSEKNQFNTSLHYAVSPQHTGVYPIYDSLYNVWKEVWNIKVTSTEEYPHFEAPERRRGFVHNGVMVMPRQTCGLFTHTHYFHALPNGIEAHRKYIEGGPLFKSLLFNQFNIFMTHQQNFGNDRLGEYTFTSLFNFVKCHTNLNMSWIGPQEMGKRYFERYPQFKKVLYTDLCSDKRHVKGLPSEITCRNVSTLPNLLILGPQKTGTTALSTFLKLHPNVSSNVDVPGSFEEAQFFGMKNYERGLKSYEDLFPKDNSSSAVVFEKSANYFDNPETPAAVKELIPNAKLLIILMDPVDRAYSWYQHMLSHNDSAARNYTPFRLFSGKNVSAEAKKLRDRCLKPGFYSRHLETWLNHFSHKQFIFVDGSDLKSAPANVLKGVTKQLQLPEFDYQRKLKFNDKKGYFCAGSKCLGPGKGRKYPQMSTAVRNLLSDYFKTENESLKKLLSHYKIHLPYFLKNPQL